MNKTPGPRDFLWLCLFVIFITLQPFFLEHEIIMMETGIHLPAINVLFHGALPYRDFFFLRGPLELYVPALMIWAGGMNMIFLPVFYYLGTVATLLFCVLIGRYLFRSRWIFYLMVVVLVARTFPRIAYYYWGGMRYAVGFAALSFGLLYFKTQKKRWMFVAGIISALALLTSLESGVCTVAAFVGALGFAWVFQPEQRKHTLQAIGQYVLGLFLIITPYLAYLAVTDALKPFLETMYTVVRFNHVAYPGEYGAKPETLQDWFLAFWPGSRYFKYLTPAFCFLFFAGYIVQEIRRKRLSNTHVFLVGMAVYGLILYLAAFRKIEGHHFEMALQAEKFLLFFLFEEMFFFFQSVKAKQKLQLKLLALGETGLNWQKAKLLAINFIFFAFVISSLGFSIQRFERRFTVVKWVKKNIFHQRVEGISLLEKEETEVLRLKRADGMIVPRWQAQEIREVVRFLEDNTRSDEPVFTYPELGNFNFWADRPFVGRFPIATFTWMSDPWHRELLADFQKTRPRYVIMTNLGHRTFPDKWYFRNPQNRERFNTFTKLILDNYEPVKAFESVSIYKRKM